MKAKVTIDIKYETPCCHEDIENALSFAVEHLANNGLLSDEESVISGYSYDVAVDVYEGGND